MPPPWDKLTHTTLFAGLASLLWIVTGARRPHLVTAMCLAIGALDELAQTQLPGRSASLADFAFDVCGTCAAVWCLTALRRRLVPKPRAFGQSQP